MANKTYLQLVNEVLTALRESTVATVSETTYSALVGQKVNQAKRTVEEAWDWTRLWTTIEVTTSAGIYQYTLTGAGDRFRLIENTPPWNDTEEIFLVSKDIKWLNRHLRDDSATTEKPVFYGFNGADANGDPNVDLYPIPDGAYVIQFDLVVPQVDLSDEADVIVVPWYPVYLKAKQLMISERGEDGGVSFDENNSEYMTSLYQAMGQDNLIQPSKLNLYVD